MENGRPELPEGGTSGDGAAPAAVLPAPPPAQRRGEPAPLPSLARYAASLDAAVAWLLRSVEHGRGGSCAHYGVWGAWSKPYPETTGYLIPTLLDYARRTGRADVRQVAEALGAWLLEIQDPGGYWHGGLHPAPRPDPSVFNTAQILQGLCALYAEDGDARWLDAAARGATWLAGGVNEAGEWSAGNYQKNHRPSYYTRVAWPMLQVWQHTGAPSLRDAAVRVLENVRARRLENGAFERWELYVGFPAFTHTMAYTLRGFLESARLLDDWEAYGAPTTEALDRLARSAELAGGRLPGAFYADWTPVRRYTCLTGSDQIALCLIRYYEQTSDLRLLNAACKLVDDVCRAQSLRHPLPGIRGGIPGSRPLWGRYMALRYPNWAAKFHCDALMMLEHHLTALAR